MKNGEILKLYETLVRVNKNNEIKFNVLTGYTLVKNRIKLEPEAKAIYEARKEILLKYGTTDKNGDIIVPKENVESANKEINELMEIENDVKIIQLALDDFEGIELCLEDIDGLSYMINDQIIRTGPPILVKN